MKVSLPQKVQALALPVHTPERALALALLESREQNLIVYPVAEGNEPANEYRYFCVLPHGEPEKSRTRDKLLVLFQTIGSEEVCNLWTCEEPYAPRGVNLIYFKFEEKK